MPKFHLVVDEVAPVASHRFRVQVWRRADSLPLVLLSQVKGHPPPDWYNSQLANLVIRAFLGYSARAASRRPASRGTRARSCI